MNPEEWDRLHSAFFAALALEPADRSRFIDEVCGENAEFRAELQQVLAGHESARLLRETDDVRAETFAEAIANTASAGASVSEGAGISPDAGQVIGPYHLVERIGQGGMGDVYRAHRVDGQFRQEVAIKLIRANLPAHEMVRRFRVERQVLARLQHPHITPLLDGGVTADGLPYLVMQYVNGKTITQYCDDQQLTLHERLRLFNTVCRAVHYAHVNLVVHRDLKPSNILVSTNGEVRLLDFGIAKLLDPEQMGITAPLTVEHLLLTPGHAAPEQIQGGAITTATDVYALGVLLYELVVGRLPFAMTDLAAWKRAVCETDPPSPAMHNDLDHVVLMALRKEPERRYASAEQFAEDVERYLERRPVLAKPDTPAYRVNRFLRRNRAAVTAAAVMFVMLVSATVFTTYQSHQRAVALAAASAERAKAENIATFMLSIFQANDPAISRGGTVTARELLDRAAERIDRNLNAQPLRQADMKLSIGRAYGALGMQDKALPLFEDVLRQRRASLGNDGADVAEALNQWGRALAANGRIVEAIPEMRQALAMRERTFGPNDTLVAATLTYLARMEIDQGNYALARSQLERAVTIYRTQPVVDGKGLANALRFLWLAYNWADENEKGLPIAAAALAATTGAVPADDPLLLNVKQDYALALESVNQFDSAAVMYAGILEARRRILGPEHPDNAYSYHNLARVLRKLKRIPESLEAFQTALKIRERGLGPDHPAVAYILHDYAVALADGGQYKNAADLEKRAIPMLESALGAEHLNTMDSMEFLAQLEATLGHNEAALVLLEKLSSRGWANMAVMEDASFKPLAANPRFLRVLERVRSNAKARSVGE